MRWLAAVLLLALSSCARPTATVDADPPRLCRVGPDGRAVADRGIGGTGAPLVQSADRGIGGTGIIGVITGFGSVCVAGEEVALTPGVPVRSDAEAAKLGDLRAGQVIAMAAGGPPSALQARSIVVRHAVVGPVETVGPGRMVVAGQSVATADAVGAGLAAAPGQWVAVSGLPRSGGAIAATRIDPAPAGPVVVRGSLIRIFGVDRIGSLTVRLPDGSALPAGWPVTVQGRLERGVLVADTAVRDVASESPATYFGPSVTSFVIEAGIVAVDGGYLVDSDFVSGGGFARAGESGRGIARFERGPGGLVATGLQLNGDRGAGGLGAGGFAAPGFAGAAAGRAGGPGTGGLGGGAPGGLAGGSPGGPGGVGGFGQPGGSGSPAAGPQGRAGPPAGRR